MEGLTISACQTLPSTFSSPVGTREFPYMEWSIEPETIAHCPVLKTTTFRVLCATPPHESQWS